MQPWKHYVPVRSDNNGRSSGQSKESEFLNAIKNDELLTLVESAVARASTMGAVQIARW